MFLTCILYFICDNNNKKIGGRNIRQNFVENHQNILLENRILIKIDFEVPSEQEKEEKKTLVPI